MTLLKAPFGPLEAFADRIELNLLPACDHAALDADPALYCAQIVDQAMAQYSGSGQAMIALGGQVALKQRLPDPFQPDPAWLGDPQLEALGAIGTLPAVKGVGLAGLISGWADGSVADGVVTFAKDAVTAYLAARQIALAIEIAPEKQKRDIITDNLGRKHEVPAIDGHLDPEATWDALAPAARLASDLRQSGKIKGAALSVRGRGRLIGNVQPNALLRFRASEWR